MRLLKSETLKMPNISRMSECGDSYLVKYHYLVVKKDIPRLDRNTQQRIKTGIERKLTTNPEVFSEPLRKSLRGYRKLRVGDYRVVLKIESKTVFILLIEHRSVVYKEIHKRIF